MKNIILLFLTVPFFSYGLVVCNEIDGKMVCSGTGQLEADIGGNYVTITNLVVTNVLGVCTNCVQMSSSTCDSIKNNILGGLEEINNYVTWVIPESLDEIDDNLARASTYLESVVQNHDIPPSEELSYIEYYLDSRIPDDVNQVRNNLSSIRTPLNASYDALWSINCEECQSFSPEVVTNNNYIVITNQGEIANGNWATYDQMVALQKSVSDINTFVKNIKEQVEQQHQTISNFWHEMHRDLQGISNLVHRLDDYVLGDYSNSVVHITQNMIMLTNELSNIQRRFYVDYKSITDESNIDDRLKSVIDSKGNWDTEALSLKTNWFDRIELYIARIAGLPNQTEDEEITVPESPVDTTQLDEELSKSEALKDDLQALESTESTRLQEISSAIQSIFKTISDFVNVTPTKEIDIITSSTDQEFMNLTLLNEVDIYVDTDQPHISNILKIFRLATSAFWICSIAALTIFLLFQIYSGLKKLFFYVLDFVNALYGNL